VKLCAQQHHHEVAPESTYDHTGNLRPRSQEIFSQVPKILLLMTIQPRGGCGKIAIEMNAAPQKETVVEQSRRDGNRSGASFPAAADTRFIAVLAQQAGYTLIEAVVIIALLGVLVGIAMPHFSQQRIQIVNAQRLAIASLRLARSNAISKSVHFQVAFPDATHIRVARMVETPADSGNWYVDTSSVQTTALPVPTSFASTLIGTAIEFNSRGYIVDLKSPVRIDTQDTFGTTKSLQVWPSGQIYDL